MSNINQTATVTLQANGQQVTSTLNQLKKQAQELESAFAKAAAAGNKTQMKAIQKELTNTRRKIREMTSSAEQAEAVLRRLDKATPRELNQTLRTLQKEMQGIERGSAAWNAHTEKIRMVKAELAKLNSEVRLSESGWERFNRKLNDWQTSLMGIVAAVTGVIMAGRKAVNSFASMEEEMANAFKYTGMTKNEVEELNKAFQKMDTRTSREQLNELAQEAGRLGKNNLKDVLGYVEAADIINVALVDLGAGATQTIAKIANIFGVEQALGTKEAMLSIGSAVNVLSQNCTASKPYLVEFAQRMAGIGAQAGLSVPEILAFGAVLDANGQKVEMSATAIQKVIMKLANSNSELAKQVGLDAKVLNETLKHSAKDGLLMFLEQLHAIGEQGGYENATMSLAPAFKEMGLDAARVATVLSTLAKHIEEVKDQVGNANKAFNEATSATNEFNIFNNTTQAGLDKARKRIAELAVELGEKLLPVMKHVMTSTSLIMRCMNVTIDFIIKYWTEIRTATILLAAYTIGVNANAIATKASAMATAAWNAVVRIATGITKGYTAAMVLSRDAVVGCSLAHQRLYKHMLAQNVVTKLLSASTLLMRAAYYACTLQVSAMTATLKSLYVVMAANPYGLILTALAAIGSAIYSNIQKKKEEARLREEEMRQQREMMKEYDTAYAKIRMLNKILNDNTRELNDRKAALDELKKIVPDYHADLTTEGTLINNNTEALDGYLKRLKQSILMKANREKLEQLYLKQDELEKQERTDSDAYWNARHNNTAGGYDRNSFIAKIMRGIGIEDETNLKKTWDATKEQLRTVNREIAELEKIVVPEPEFPTTQTTTTTGTTNKVVIPTTTTDTTTKAKEDPFKEENDWKKREEAYNRIAYAIGKKNHEEYNKRILEIEVEYNKKKLEHTNLTEDERTQILADYHEAVKAQTENTEKLTLAQEEEAYNKRLLEIRQFYVDGKLTTEAYNMNMEQAELDHARNMVRITKEGTKERYNAEVRYAELQIKAQEKRQKETEEKERKHQEELKKMKDKYFGNNPQENKIAFDADFSALKEVYNAELAAAGDNAKEKLRIEEAFEKAKIALMLKYNQEGAELNKNTLQEWNESVVSFLESDLGGAVQGALETFESSMSAIFSQLSSMVQSELQIQEAALDKRYAREISLAEGNKFKVNQLEKQKEKEQAKMKKEANRKMFAMQVIQAVASTALSAINAYSSAAQVPMIGYILAPIAAATAVAAGMLQVAAIKKQQQASEATGYFGGGFTPEGRLDEPVGVVHAGEWVASNRLIKSPVARPVIDALDYAQRTNTIGSLRSIDAARVASPVIVRQVAPVAPIVVPGSAAAEPSGDNLNPETILALQSTIASLNRRLNEPFVTVNTVEGDAGIKKAQSDYEKLMRNKTPKSRR